MKLYIPTCTLNLNNIFSTESISPPSFYQQRKFGMKRFEKVAPSDAEHSIVLYSVLPHYKLQDRGLDNYPMVIEIETDTLPASPTFFKQIDDVKIYTYTSTIYLNPATTIIYINDNAFPIIQSRADESGENKLFPLYYDARCFRKPTATKQSFEWTPEHTKDIPDYANLERENEIEKDHTINRLKGFAYCYLIGANSSVPEKVADLRLLTKSIKNTLAAIINSPTRKPTTPQDNKLLHDTKQFNLVFQSIDKTCVQNQIKIDHCIAKIDLKRDNLTKDSFLRLLERAGLKEVFLRNCAVSKEYDAFGVYSCITCPDAMILDEYHRVISELSSAVLRVEQDQVQLQIKPDNLFLLSSDGKIDIIDKTFNLTYYNDFVTALIQGEHADEKLAKNLAVALTCGNILKQHLSTQWKGSLVQEYLNELLASLQEASRPFNINATESNELKALAAVAQKCSDLDKLSGYLLSSGFNDYRLAYGLYGATEGFATLSKAFTRGLLDRMDSYSWSVYKFIYQGCLGVRLDLYPMGEEHTNTASLNTPTGDEQIPLAAANPIEKLLQDLEQNVPKFTEIKKKDSKRWIIEQLTECYEGRIDSFYLEKLQSKKIPHGAGEAFTACKKYLQKLLKYQRLDGSSQKAVPIQVPLPGATAKLFFDDPNAYSTVEDFLRNANVSTTICGKIINNLSYIQREYRPGGRYFREGQKHPRDNFSVINHFKRLCFSPKHSYRIEKSPDNESLLNQLVSVLHKEYPS